MSLLDREAADATPPRPDGRAKAGPSRVTKRRAKLVCLVLSAAFVVAALGVFFAPAMGILVRSVAARLLSPGMVVVFLPLSLTMGAAGIGPHTLAVLTDYLGAAMDVALYAALSYAVWRWVFIHDGR